jgi:hypothetical protein
VLPALLRNTTKRLSANPSVSALPAFASTLGCTPGAELAASGLYPSITIEGMPRPLSKRE